MVHRPADSRLLTNVLSHEKEYAKQLQSLLASSQSSLASFAAYAAASPPPASQTILKVAGVLSAADGALASYASAVDQWRETMRALQALEDEVGNIVRDREILVTRLIKVSKSQKSTNQRFASNSSISMDTPSPSPQHTRTIASSSKVSAAQAELQACETHLAAKENELALRRTSAVRDGLNVRCQALVQCGWAWTELGKEAIGVLESPELASDGHGIHRPRLLHESFPHHDHNKPLPPHQDDRSSLGPSRSASQIHLPNGMHDNDGDSSTSLSHYSQSTEVHMIQIPAAHAIDSELVMPMPVMGSASGHKRDSLASTPRLLSPQSQRSSWMSGSSEWRFETPMQSFSELPLSSPHSPIEEQQQRPPLPTTPQRRSFIEVNHRMSRSETQLVIQQQPSQQEIRSRRQSTSFERTSSSPTPHARPLSWTNVPGPSSALILDKPNPEKPDEKATSSMFTGGPTLFASAEKAHNTVWDNVAASAPAGSSSPALKQPLGNDRPTAGSSSSSPPRTSQDRTSPTKRGPSLFTGGPTLYTATAPGPVSLEAASTFTPSGNPSSQPHISTMFTGGPTLYASAPPPLDVSNYASTSAAPPPTSFRDSTHVLTHRITEEELRSDSGTEGGSSVEAGERDELGIEGMIRAGRLGVVQNPKFNPPPSAVATPNKTQETAEGLPSTPPHRVSADEGRVSTENSSPSKVGGGVFGRRFSGFRNGQKQQKRERAASDAGSGGGAGQGQGGHVRSGTVPGTVTTGTGVVSTGTRTSTTDETPRKDSSTGMANGTPVQGPNGTAIGGPAKEQVNQINNTPTSPKGSISSSSPSKSKFMGSLRLLFSAKPPAGHGSPPLQPQKVPSSPPRQRATENEDAESIASSDNGHFPAPSGLTAHDNPNVVGRPGSRKVGRGKSGSTSTLHKSSTKTSPSKPSVLGGLFGSRKAESSRDVSSTKWETRTDKNIRALTKENKGSGGRWLVDSSGDEGEQQRTTIVQGHLREPLVEPLDLRVAGHTLEGRYRGDRAVGEAGFGAAGAPVPLVSTHFQEQVQRKRRGSTSTDVTTTQKDADATSQRQQGGRRLKKSRSGREGKEAKGKSEAGSKKVKNKPRSSSVPPGAGSARVGGEVEPVPALPVALRDAPVLPKPKEKEVDSAKTALVRRKSSTKKTTTPTTLTTADGGGPSSQPAARVRTSSQPTPSAESFRATSAKPTYNAGLSPPATGAGLSQPSPHSRASTVPPHLPLNVAAAGMSYPGTGAAGPTEVAPPHHTASHARPHGAHTKSAMNVPPSHPATSSPSRPPTSAPLHPAISTPRPAMSAAPSRPPRSATVPHHATTSSESLHRAGTSTVPPTTGASLSRPTSVRAHSSTTTLHGTLVLPAGGDPTGTLTSGGWGGTKGGLSRQSSVFSGSSAPIGVEKGKAQATLGQGMGLGRRASVTGVPKDGSTPLEGQKPKRKRSSSMNLGSSSASTFVAVDKERAGPTAVKKTTAASTPAPASHGLSHAQSYTHFPPAGTTSTSESLMSIVESVARGNRQSWDTGEESVRVLKSTGGLQRPIGTMQVEVVRAPPRVGRETLLAEMASSVKPGSGGGAGARGRGEGMPEVPRAPPPVSVIKGPGPLSMSNLESGSKERPKAAAPAPARRSSTNVANRPTKSPLRSALKSPSRDPSPHGPRDAPIPISVQRPRTMPAPMASSSAPTPSSAPTSSSAAPGTEMLAPPLSYTEASGSGKIKGHEKRKGEENVDDGVSDSPYETGNEVVVPDRREVTQHQSMPNGSANPQIGSSDASSSNFSGVVQHQRQQPTPGSESTPGQAPPPPPRRRKSVRVSLQPTFSPTPPAIDYDDDEDEAQKHAPWVRKPEENQASTSQLPVQPSQAQSQSKQSTDVPKDMWADSDTDENDEYKNAKLLLARAARKTTKRRT